MTMDFESAKKEMSKFSTPTKDTWEAQFDSLFVVLGKRTGTPMLRANIHDMKNFIRSVLGEPVLGKKPTKELELPDSVYGG